MATSKKNKQKFTDEEIFDEIDNFLQTAFSIVNNWVAAGANPFDLYKSFWDLNEENGFHEEKQMNESTQTDLFSKNLEGLLAVPPPNKGTGANK